jgi:hypothetical protein
MALTCPKCDRTNKCDCKSCNPNGDAKDLVIILEDEECYQCCFCGHKFNEQDSLDHDWERMIKDYAKKATPELCLEWILMNYKQKKDLEAKTNIGEFGFHLAFREHFKLNWKNIDGETIERLNTQVKRDKVIDKLIK